MGLVSPIQPLPLRRRAKSLGRGLGSVPPLATGAAPSPICSAAAKSTLGIDECVAGRCPLHAW